MLMQRRLSSATFALPDSASDAAHISVSADLSSQLNSSSFTLHLLLVVRCPCSLTQISISAPLITH